MLAGDIARRAALAIHNAQSTAAHVEVSQALQQALLPRALPVAPGLDVAAAYLPASTGSDVGGDFYDVLTVDPARWLVSIGDVCGKGARAAARTGLVRDVLRVLVREGRPLPEAVATLNDVMMEAADPLQFCTLATATVRRTRLPEPPGLVVDLALAGHLQPVLVRASGADRAGRRVRHRGRADPDGPGGQQPAPAGPGRHAAVLHRRRHRAPPRPRRSSAPTGCSAWRPRRPGSPRRSWSRRCGRRSRASPPPRWTTTWPCSRCARRPDRPPIRVVVRRPRPDLRPGLSRRPLSGASWQRTTRRRDRPPLGSTQEGRALKTARRPLRGPWPTLLLVLFCLGVGLPVTVALTPGQEIVAFGQHITVGARPPDALAGRPGPAGPGRQHRAGRAAAAGRRPAATAAHAGPGPAQRGGRRHLRPAGRAAGPGRGRGRGPRRLPDLVRAGRARA